MDPTRPISYRGFNFNTIDSLEDSKQRGCRVDHVWLGDVEVDGYTEKRSLDDGHDASDVFQGMRTIRMVGTLFGESRGALFDRLRAMRAAVNPRLAYDEVPEEKGYLPLLFYEPTEVTGDWDEGVIPLFIKSRAVTGVRTDIEYRGAGGEDSSPLALPYDVTFRAIDPRVYAQNRSEHFINGTAGDITFVNRGTYMAPLNILLVLGAQAAHARTFTFTGAGTTFDLVIPAGDESLVVRFDGMKKVVTSQTADDASTEKLVMDFVSEDLVWPVVPHGDTDASWLIKRDDDTDAEVKVNSLMWFRESFA